jgi:hypothetical protein
MERERSYKSPEPIYLTESEYQMFKYLDTPDNIFPDTPEAHALVKKLAGKDIRNIQVKKDMRIMRTTKDMRTSVHLPPRASEEHYPRASDVSSHPHAVGKTDTGKLYASDYFRGNQNEYQLSFLPLQRRVDKTPQSPIIGQGKAIIDSIRTQEGIFAGTQLAFQGAIPDAYRQGFIALSAQ